MHTVAVVAAVVDTVVVAAAVVEVASAVDEELTVEGAFSVVDVGVVVTIRTSFVAVSPPSQGKLLCLLPPPDV